MVEKFSKLINNLKLISVKEQGKGLAVKGGMLAAQGKYRAFMDADDSISSDQIIDVLPYFKNGYDVVIGSRNIKGGKRDQPWYRIVSSGFGNLIIQALLLPGIWDTQCPMKIFSAEAAEKVFGLSRIKHFGFDVEVLSLAKEFGYKIKEVPAVFKNNPNSKVKASSYLEVLWEVLKIRFWLWTKAYIDAPPKG